MLVIIIFSLNCQNNNPSLSPSPFHISNRSVANKIFGGKGNFENAEITKTKLKVKIWGL